MTLDLDELERIGQQATSAPWKLTDPKTIPDSMRWILEPEMDFEKADALWCVTARNNWQAMIDELRKARADLSLLLGTAGQRVKDVMIENERLIADAARWRYVREHGPAVLRRVAGWAKQPVHDCDAWFFYGDADSAVDKEIAKVTDASER